jgi:hypothetical protein
VLSDDDIKEPATELAKDLLSIVTVFATDAADATDGSEGWLLPKPLVHEENKVQILPLLAEFEESVAGRCKVGVRSEEGWWNVGGRSEECRCKVVGRSV